MGRARARQPGRPGIRRVPSRWPTPGAARLRSATGAGDDALAGLAVRLGQCLWPWLAWVGALWPHGVVIITPDDVDPDGQLSMKFGWYRLTSGYLTITGRRLDPPAPPASG